MSKQRKNYPLRLPEELFNEIKRWAEVDMRSVNGQIEFLLRQAVNRRKRSNGSGKTSSADEASESDSAD